VEDVVAVEVRLTSGESRYFITWGRVFGAVEPEPLTSHVLAASRTCALGGDPVSAHLCYSLQEAQAQTYFYEALVTFAAELAKRGSTRQERDDWAAARAEEMAQGMSIYYLGLPRTAADS
jgi:hypothetical protein